MKKTLTPSQVARALQVSESSVKRWCDQGAIGATYTAGGHRRISPAALVTFLRSSRHQLADPSVVGLPPGIGATPVNLEVSSRQFQAALAAGDESECRRIILGLFLEETSVAAICDLVISKAVNRLGDDWACRAAEVYQERRGCEIVGALTHELTSLLPAPPANAPIAIGGGIEDDPYSLANPMVALVLKDANWRATTLGPGLPWHTIWVAIKRECPKLCWLSVAVIPDLACFVREYNNLYDEYSSQVAFVIGGKAITAEVRQRIKYASFCDTLQHLEQFANTLLNPSLQEL